MFPPYNRNHLPGFRMASQPDILSRNSLGGGLNELETEFDSFPL